MKETIKRDISCSDRKWKGDEMLILSRKKGEAIQIGTDIEISVTAIQGDQVKIGINAPKNVEVHRKELWLEIQNENTAALKEVSDLSSIMKNTKKD